MTDEEINAELARLSAYHRRKSEELEQAIAEGRVMEIDPSLGPGFGSYAEDDPELHAQIARECEAEREDE